MKRIIAVILSLALVAGLFVFIFEKFFKKNTNFLQNENDIKTEKLEKNDEILNDATNEKLEISSKSLSKQELAKIIFDSIKIEEKNEKLHIIYSQPEIKNDYHFSLKAEIFDMEGKSVDRYVSDAGYLEDPSRYDSREKTEDIEMKISSLKNRFAAISVSVGDAEHKEKSEVYQLTINYDGSRTSEHELR